MNKCLSQIKPAGMFVVLFTCFTIMTSCGDRRSNTHSEREEPVASDQQRMSQQRPDTNAGMSENQGKSFAATLSGMEEVPPIKTQGKGNIVLQVRGDSVYVTGEFSGLGSSYLASHIHKEAKGKTGDPLITLNPEIGPDSTSGSWEGSYKLSPSLLGALKTDSLYINVHSSDHEKGEIRGQLMASTRSDSVMS